VEVRVLPALQGQVEPRCTRIYLGGSEVDLLCDPTASFRFVLGQASNYSYHRTYVQFRLFDNVRPWPPQQLLMPKSLCSAERYFRGHCLLNLSDIHPVFVENTGNSPDAVTTLPFTSLSVRDSPALVEIVRRSKDRLCKEYVTELNQMRDSVAMRLPFSPYDWADVGPKATTTELISRVMT